MHIYLANVFATHAIELVSLCKKYFVLFTRSSEKQCDLLGAIKRVIKENRIKALCLSVCLLRAD